MDGLEKTSTDNLLVIRDNLLSGLDKVAVHVENGTLDTAPGPKVNPPRAGGQLTLLLLIRVNEILDTREVAPKW